MSDWVTVARYDLMTDAHIALGKLGAAGIEAGLMDEHLVQTDWLYAIAVGGIKLRVPAADAERARAVLDEDWSADLDDRADPGG